jgi:hypothetical protein
VREHVEEHCNIQDDVYVQNHSNEGYGVLYGQILYAVALHDKISNNQNRVQHNAFNPGGFYFRQKRFSGIIFGFIDLVIRVQ